MMKLRLLGLLCLILALLSFAACSAKNNTPASAPSPMPSAAPYEYGESDGKYLDLERSGVREEAQAVDMEPDPLRKIIWTGEAVVETQDYESDYEEFQLLISECGGYIQSSSVTGGGILRSGERRMRSARLTVRVPSENFSLFMGGAGRIGTLISSGTDSSDVTDDYFDMESRLKVLRVKEQRLIEMISREGTLEDLLKLEQELSETLYEIESLTGKLRKYDGLISYGTVTLYLNEVSSESTVPADTGVMTRLSYSFDKSLLGLVSFLTSLFVFIVGNSPAIVFVLLLAFGAFMTVRALRRRRLRKNMLIEDITEKNVDPEGAKAPPPDREE